MVMLGKHVESIPELGGGAGTVPDSVGEFDPYRANCFEFIDSTMRRLELASPVFKMVFSHTSSRIRRTARC